MHGERGLPEGQPQQPEVVVPGHWGSSASTSRQVLPDRMPVNQMTTVHLTIRTLPELPAGANYKCVFGNAEPIDALMTGFGLSCPTPPVMERPNIPEAADHVLVPLSVRSSETNKDFVSRNFAFFDCSRHTVCTECVKAQWACSWCVYDNKCTHNTSCQGIISGENVSIFKAAFVNAGSIVVISFEKGTFSLDLLSNFKILFGDD